jgi:hypothetical protein
VAAPAPAAPLHQLPARVGATPPGRPSTTPGLAPSTCGRACQGHQSRPDRRTPSSLYHRWGHRSRLLRCVCVFLALHHLSSSPGEWDPQSLNGSFSTMELTPPCPPLTGWPTLAPSTTPPSTQVASHLPTPPSTFHPHSIIVGNGSILPVTSVGDSVLPRPFYLNDVLVAPDLVQSLLSVRHFTIDNSCSMEFDPFGLSVKDLATWSVIVRYDSSGPLYTIPAFCVGHLLRRCSTVHPSSHGFGLHLAPPSWSSWPRRPLLAVTQLSDYMS